MTDTVWLPTADGEFVGVEPTPARTFPTHPDGFDQRVAFAAAHVAVDPHADSTPGSAAIIDWESTLGFRQHLFSYGFGVAEAMDTAQRNQGLDWNAIQELVTASAAQASESGARIAAGVGTDHRPDVTALEAISEAYLEQLEFVEGAGSQAIIMASRQLAAAATTADDYHQVFTRVIGAATAPVIVHWLGEMFDPQLAGYWGSRDLDAATDSFVALITEHADRIDGVKVSLLSLDHEVGLRARLPGGVRLYTGDDFNYPTLIRGDGTLHSDALLGAFAAIAPAASAALAALDQGDLATYDAEMNPTLALSRHIFSTPTYYYKVGIALMAWLNGYQPGFSMIGGLQSARSAVHLAETYRLANDARLLVAPDLAAGRMSSLLDVLGATR